MKFIKDIKDINSISTEAAKLIEENLNPEQVNSLIVEIGAAQQGYSTDLSPNYLLSALFQDKEKWKLINKNFMEKDAYLYLILFKYHDIKFGFKLSDDEYVKELGYLEFYSELAFEPLKLLIHNAYSLVKTSIEITRDIEEITNDAKQTISQNIQGLKEAYGHNSKTVPINPIPQAPNSSFNPSSNFTGTSAGSNNGFFNTPPTKKKDSSLVKDLVLFASGIVGIAAAIWFLASTSILSMGLSLALLGAALLVMGVTAAYSPPANDSAYSL